jgi:hypothetical protein
VSSRWPSDLLPAALGAVVEGVWTGALLALVTGDHGAAAMAGAAAAVFAAAVLARRAARDPSPTRAARASVVALTLLVAAVPYAALRAWAYPSPAASAVGTVIFAAVLVFLGISLGRETVSPDAALRRSVRSFALLCLLLVIAALAGAKPGWAGGAVVAAIVAGTLFVAAARSVALAEVVPAADRAPVWRWFLTVVGVLLLVVVVGVLISLALSVDVLLWALAAIGGVLRLVLQVIGFAGGWVGAGLVRALSWLLGLFHVHGLPQVKPPRALNPHNVTPRRAPAAGTWGAARLAVTIAAAAVAIVVPLALVALALRRFRGVAPEGVLEEREPLLTLREASGEAAARLGRRLARLVPHRRPPATPAEQVRRRYRELERRLAAAGHSRPPAITVRAFLGTVTNAAAATAVASPSPTATATAAELSRVYELARYSDRGVDAAAAQRFEALAADLASLVPAKVG